MEQSDIAPLAEEPAGMEAEPQAKEKQEIDRIIFPLLSLFVCSVVQKLFSGLAR